MPVELIVPSVGESITEVEIGDWLKKARRDRWMQDEPVVVIETDKVSVELPAPTAGTITKLLKHTGEKAAVGESLAIMEPISLGGGATASRLGAPGSKVLPPPASSGACSRAKPLPTAIRHRHAKSKSFP